MQFQPHLRFNTNNIKYERGHAIKKFIKKMSSCSLLRSFIVV